MQRYSLKPLICVFSTSKTPRSDLKRVFALVWSVWATISLHEIRAYGTWISTPLAQCCVQYLSHSVHKIQTTYFPYVPKHYLHHEKNKFQFRAHDALAQKAIRLFNGIALANGGQRKSPNLRCGCQQVRLQ